VRGGPEGCQKPRFGPGVVVLTPFTGLTQELRLTRRSPRYRRRAPTQVDEYQPLMLEIFTTSPVCGEWMKLPPPM
jgi:hypothetical protein